MSLDDEKSRAVHIVWDGLVAGLGKTGECVEVRGREIEFFENFNKLFPKKGSSGNDIALSR